MKPTAALSYDCQGYHTDPVTTLCLFVLQKPKVEVKDRSEMDSTDKKRIRRTKKAKIRKNEALKKKIEQRVKKLAPGLGNKRAEQRSIEAIKQAVVNDGKIIKPTKVCTCIWEVSNSASKTERYVSIISRNKNLKQSKQPLGESHINANMLGAVII